jgi:LPXTG-motif cell wall-anchored protein
VIGIHENENPPGGGGVVTAPDGGLSYTGVAAGSMTLVGIALATAGVVLLLVVRRRRRSEPAGHSRA